MKILFLSPVSPSRELGASKVVVELAEEMQGLGWECDVRGIRDILPDEVKERTDRHSLSEGLRQFMREHAADYDVVDYDHPYLPFARENFSKQTLFVARSVMLAHHFESYPIPTAQNWRSHLGSLIKGRARRRHLKAWIDQATLSVQEADLINVCNSNEKSELVRRGIPKEKIVFIPFGISRTRRPLFDAVPSTPPERPIVAFVGTFDYRKGANEFPKIVSLVSAAVPEVSFRLFGTAGMFSNAEQVLAHFPRRLRHRIEVTPKFDADDLPSLLAPCSAGVFPSYIEGFPFGVLEMLAASLPVFAYDVPGPRETLPAEHLTPPGDAQSMGVKVADLLTDHTKLSAARHEAKKISQQYTWAEAAKTTHEIYTRLLRNRSSV